MKTFRALLALSALSMLPMVQASPADNSARLAELQQTLLLQGKDLNHDITQTKKIVRDGIRLKSLSQDSNLKMRVKQFNATFDELISECAKQYNCERPALEEAVLKSNFGRILTQSTFTPANDLPPSRRVMVLLGAETYTSASGPDEAETKPHAFSIYYTEDAELPAGDEERVELYNTAMLGKKGEEAIGWVPRKFLRKWDHNIVLQFRNPQNRQIEIPGSESPAYIPNPIFYADAGNDFDTQGATGPFNKFAGMDAEGKLAEARPLLHNYQMGTGAVEKNASYNEAAAKEFQSGYGVRMTLTADSYNEQLILPIVDTGKYGYTDATGQTSLPYKVLMLGVNTGEEKPADTPDAGKTEIYIVMDLSGSMEKFIGGLKDALKAQVDSIPAEFKDKIRLGFIGYRDDPVQGGHTFEAFKFHGRRDGLSESKIPFYNYTYDGLLPVEQFISRLEQVRTPQGELESIGYKSIDKGIKDLLRDDVPERLFLALDEALTSDHWTPGETAKKFVVIVGDAPDKSAKSKGEGISEAARLKETAEASKIYLAPLFIDNAYYEKQKRFRDIGQRQFTALGAKEGAIVRVDKEGNIRDGHDHAAAFKAIVGTIIEKSVGQTAPAPTQETDGGNIKKMQDMADSLFAKAYFETNKNKILKADLGSAEREEADTTGTREYWVTEYDPLAVAAGADDGAARIYDRYALMTKPQLRKWIEIANAVYFRMMETDPENESAIYNDLAALFLSGGYNAEAVQRAYGSEERWDKLIDWATTELPCPSPFLSNFFRFKKGQRVSFNFKSELDAFGRGIIALREQLDSGKIMQPADEVKVNTGQTSANALPDDKKIYKIPLKFLP